MFGIPLTLSLHDVSLLFVLSRRNVCFRLFYAERVNGLPEVNRLPVNFRGDVSREAKNFDRRWLTTTGSYGIS